MNKKNILIAKVVTFFLFILIVYNLNGRIIYTNDSTATNLLPLSIIKEFNVDLNEFPFLYKGHLPYFLTYYRGHYYSNYSIITAILASPIYIIPYFSGWIKGILNILLLAKISASILTSLSAVFLLLALLRLPITPQGEKLNEAMAFFIASLYALASSTWTISSQALWEHTSGQFFITGALLFIVLAQDNQKYLFLASAFCAFACVSRLNNVIAILSLTVYIIIKYKKQSWKFFILPTIIASWHFTYNISHFDSFLGGADKLAKQMIIRNHIRGGFNGKLWEGLLGILFSPNRGLLIFSPWLILSFVGIIIIWTKRQVLLFKCISIGILGTISLFSLYTGWWGGLCYGPRYLVDILPLLSIFIIFPWEYIKNRKVLITIVGFLIAFSIGIQVIGAFYYSGEWYYSPTNVDYDHKRLWAWKDNEIIRSLKSGRQEPIFLKR